MANERLFQFPSKATPVPADIIFAGDSADAFDEVNITIAALIGAYPNLSGIGGLTLSANTFPYSNNSAVITAGTITALGVSLVADATISAMQSTLGYTATPTASLFSGWDANSNLSANSFISAYATTATAAGSTTLTVASKFQQFFTGTTTQTVLLPVTSTLVLGQSFYIVNNSTGAVTVQSSGANTIQVMAANTTLLVTCILTSGTTAASWYADYNFQTALALPLSLANGGTNAGLTASNGGIFYSTASAGAILAGTATAGLALLSGASGAPTWSTKPPITKINVQTITATGAFTYTPTAGTQEAIFELQGDGAGSGGTTGAGSQAACGGAGGGGGYLKLLVTGAANLAAITGTVGAGGAAGASGNHAGTSGAGTTLVINSGSTWTAGGGTGGAGQAATAGASLGGVPGAGGTNTAGTNGTTIINIPGGTGNYGSFGAASVLPYVESNGGNSFLGFGSFGGSGLAGGNYGGGGGVGVNGTGSNAVGFAGAQGVVIVTEYISV